MSCGITSPQAWGLGGGHGSAARVLSRSGNPAGSYWVPTGFQSGSHWVPVGCRSGSSAGRIGLFSFGDRLTVVQQSLGNGRVQRGRISGVGLRPYSHLRRSTVGAWGCDKASYTRRRRTTTTSAGSRSGNATRRQCQGSQEDSRSLRNSHAPSVCGALLLNGAKARKYPWVHPVAQRAPG